MFDAPPTPYYSQYVQEPTDSSDSTIGALVTTYTMLGVPCYNYTIIPQYTPNPILIIKVPTLCMRFH